ncbi:hypothetical protein L3X38_026151 [Prunus dulcis]|uniref:Retrotransposon gag domain-containing protein n=1 Tax=Prunus dulcis TaxID=3755 RepID=A0AAD4W5S2_PRUDU|nr:hypothetical protein L3X38_026151 [Prunus dulcis]
MLSCGWRCRSMKIDQGRFTFETWDAFKKDIMLHFYPENAKYEAKEKLRWLKQMGSMKDYVTTFTNLLFELSLLSSSRRMIKETPNSKEEKGNSGSGGGDNKPKESGKSSNKSNSHKSFVKKNDKGDKGNDKSKLACYLYDGPCMMRDDPQKKALNAMNQEKEKEANRECGKQRDLGVGLKGSRQYEDSEFNCQAIDGVARDVKLHIATWKEVDDFSVISMDDYDVHG